MGPLNLHSHMTHRSVLVLADRGQLRRQHQQKQKRRGFTSAALLKQSAALPRRFFPQKPPNDSQWVFALSSSAFCCLLPAQAFLTLPHRNLTEASRRGEGKALIYFFCYSELSDQGAVCLPTHQILGRAETTSKHCEVPFKIHLRNGRPVCHRAVHARVCVCVCMCIDLLLLQWYPAPHTSLFL